MFAVHDDEDQICAIFEDLENAEKYLCIEHENNPSYAIKELETDENTIVEVDDEEYMGIPYQFFGVEIEGEIVAAYEDKDDADTRANNYGWQAFENTAEELGYNDEDLSEKQQSDTAFQAGYDYGHPEVLKISPQDGEQYRDCFDYWKRNNDDNESDDTDEESGISILYEKEIK